MDRTARAPCGLRWLPATESRMACLVTGVGAMTLTACNPVTLAYGEPENQP